MRHGKFSAPNRICDIFKTISIFADSENTICFIFFVELQRSNHVECMTIILLILFIFHVMQKALNAIYVNKIHFHVNKIISLCDLWFAFTVFQPFQHQPKTIKWQFPFTFVMNTNAPWSLLIFCINKFNKKNYIVFGCMNPILWELFLFYGMMTYHLCICLRHKKHMIVFKPTH